MIRSFADRETEKVYMIEAWGRGFDTIRTACDSLYSTPMPEYDISDEGIMVFCKPNEKYLLLLRKDRLGIDESILSRFRAEEASSVLQIMELICWKHTHPAC